MVTNSRNLDIKSCLDFTYILFIIFKHKGDALPKNLSYVWFKVNYVRVWHSNIQYDYVHCVCNCLVFCLLKERLKKCMKLNINKTQKPAQELSRTLKFNLIQSAYKFTLPYTNNRC